MSQNKPIWHVDIHGKKYHWDKNHKIDVGILATLELWSKNSNRLEFLKDYQKSIEKNLYQAFKGIIIDNIPICLDMNPRLHGYWGDDMCTTMQHQSCLLGIPSMQLEMPHSVRRLINTNSNVRKKFAKALTNI